MPVIVELKEPGLLDQPLLQKTQYFQKNKATSMDADLLVLYNALIKSQQKWIVSLQSQPISFFYRSSCQYVGNLINLYVKGTDLDLLTTNNSVKSVILDWEEKPLRKIMSVSTGVERVWNGSHSAKATGKGIKIGIIDSGIDFNHDEFQRKIIKGYDFTTDNDFKDDGIGHGTHVAGISAGLGNTQYGKGMAYDSLLYIYKVFPRTGGGSAASDVFQALDMAVADRVDVVNMSLGHAGDAKAKEGNLYYSIIQKVIKANVFVVAAIGNSGARGKEVPWPVGSPGVVEDVFGVAASNDRKFRPTLYSEQHRIPYSLVNDFSINERIQLASSEIIDAGYGREEDFSHVMAERKICLIARGPDSLPLTFSEKFRNALQYHPKGIIFYSEELLPNMSLSQLKQTMLESEKRIPVIMIAQSDAKQLLEKANASETTLYYSDNGIGIADFSSMGPTSDGIFKPDICAPGVNILSTFLKKYKGYAELSGTSMSSPSVTGLVALLKELKPKWTMNQIKSALMNNADIIMNQINQEPITYTLQGAGQARIDKAIITEAFLAPRAFIVEDKETFTQEITIQNAQSTDLSLSPIKAEIFGLAKEEAIKIEIPAKSITLKANESTKISVHFIIQEKQFRRSKYEGNIWINQMHIPFIIYKHTTEIENRTAVKNPFSDLQIEKLDLFCNDAVTTNRIDFAFNTGSEQKFEGEIQYSNFGTIRLYLCDQQGLEWINKPIIELKQCPVGCYSYEWEYQQFIRDNNIPNGEYRLKISSSASDSFEL
ncbi:MAG: S8 family serine peptidase, partial [Caldisericia bacterium]|nr:S8 family serine peptidase [Caldisericia bacterium]